MLFDDHSTKEVIHEPKHSFSSARVEDITLLLMVVALYILCDTVYIFTVGLIENILLENQIHLYETQNPTEPP